MEHIPVVIVGGGPSGLTMGFALAKHKIHVCNECEDQHLAAFLTYSTSLSYWRRNRPSTTTHEASISMVMQSEYSTILAWLSSGLRSVMVSQP